MTLTRREFLGTVGSAALVLAAGRSAADETQLTTVTYNILGCRGYPRNKYTEAALNAAAPTIHLKIADALADVNPDVVTLCECPEEARVAAIAERLGFNYTFFPGGWPGDEEYPGGFPGAILSRHSIRDAQNSPVVGTNDPDLFTRHFGRAVVETPSGAVTVFSVHLHPNDAAIRLHEIDAVSKSIAAAPESSLGVLVQGDLNHTPDTQEHARWITAGLVDTFAAAGIGNGASFSSARARERIDYIWARGDLAEAVDGSRVLNDPPFSTDRDRRSSFALSDHMPVSTRFRPAG